MCLFENFTDVYPQETRTRQIIRRCLFSPRKGTCRCTRVYDHSEVYHTRHNQLEDRGRMTRSSLNYYPEPARPRERSTPAFERRPSLKRSNSFKLHLPFLRRTYKYDNDQDTQRHRAEEGERNRVPRTFVVDPPETRRYAHPRFETVSPQRGRSPASDRWRQHTPGDSEFPSRDPQGHQPRREPRAPRQRTPVGERVPLRRSRNSPPPRVVEIHNHRSENHGSLRTSAHPRYEERSPHNRRVRFSGDIEYERNSNKPPRNEGDYIRVEDRVQGRSSRRDSFNDNRNHEYEIFDERPNRRHHLQEQEHSPWPGRQRGIHRTGTAPIITHIRPRIIQEGHQHMSRAGERICLESRGGPYHEGNVYKKDHRRYRGHWL